MEYMAGHGVHTQVTCSEWSVVHLLPSRAGSEPVFSTALNPEVDALTCTPTYGLMEAEMRIIAAGNQHTCMVGRPLRQSCYLLRTHSTVRCHLLSPVA